MNYMEKVLVIGPGGAGKSYFSKELARATGLPLFHLDNLFWRKDRTHIDRAEFDSKILEILNKDKWIIDGDYSRTYELRIKYCDTVYFLDFCLEDCLKGVESRLGKVREDIPFIDEEFDPEFRQWIIDWFSRTRPWVIHLQEKFKEKNFIIFKNRNEVNDYLNKINNKEISL